jgi:hypothetical protein
LLGVGAKVWFWSLAYCDIDSKCHLCIFGKEFLCFYEAETTTKVACTYVTDLRMKPDKDY